MVLFRFVVWNFSLNCSDSYARELRKEQFKIKGSTIDTDNSILYEPGG